MPVRGLLDWLERPSAERGIRFAEPDGGWDFWSYARLARLVERCAAALAAREVEPGARVAVLARPGPRMVASLFGTMLAGATPTLLAPPLALQDGNEHRRAAAAVLAAADPACVLMDADLLDRVEAYAPKAVTFDALLAEAGGTVGKRDLAEHALVQFTSGTSGAARGVCVSHDALAANVAAIGQWLRITPEDTAACWLPVHHDMGLVGCLLAPVVHGAAIRLIRPEDFLRRPLRYLRCFGEDGAALTAMPAFGLDYLARRVPPRELAGLDFSRWRAIVVGAERIRADTLDRFYRLCAPHGLSRSAILPAYGLAETTLAVTGLPLGEQWGTRAVSSGAPLVGCGRVLPGMRASIVNEEGTPLPAGAVGEIVVRGDSVAAGYLGAVPDGTQTRFAGDAVYTGDAGFLVDGQLYVFGRLGDALKIRGRTLFAEDLELALTPLGLPIERYTVLLGERERAPVVVGVLEQGDRGCRVAAERILRGRSEGAEVVVVRVPPGTVPRTTSGKPKRRRVWASFLAGALPEAAERKDLG
ncbi:AMP-binding protein [Amycolatopsis sp. NPDC004079]|uniref:AMP-binding protein n=1 Tax=Amycolatopsis sp. NPDC004079 TaxID=3154549 RepID=UPI0033B92D95